MVCTVCTMYKATESYVHIGSGMESGIIRQIRPHALA